MGVELPLARECGECDRCCHALSVELGRYFKPRGEPCRHLGAPCRSDEVPQEGKGCTLHGPGKPSVCDLYECDWLQGWGEDQDRPDKLGVLRHNGELFDSFGRERCLWPHLYPLSKRARKVMRDHFVTEDMLG